MCRDRRAMDAVDPRQLPDPSTALVVGDQRLNLGRGQAPLDAAQLADVGTPRILKLRVSPHLVGLADPAEEPLYQRFVAGSEFENCLRRSPELTRNSRQPPWAWSRRACSRRTNSAAFCPGGTRRGATPSSARIERRGRRRVRPGNSRPPRDGPTMNRGQRYLALSNTSRNSHDTLRG